MQFALGFPTYKTYHIVHTNIQLYIVCEFVQCQLELGFQNIFRVKSYLGRIHLVLNKTLTDDTSVKWAQIKTFFNWPKALLRPVLNPTF